MFFQHVMSTTNSHEDNLISLRDVFKERLQEDKSLSRYTAARVGGPAKLLLEVYSIDELARAVEILWNLDCDYIILGGGSNVLVSDAGVDGVVLINRARQVHFDEKRLPPTVRAESGANFGLIARQAAQRGLAGLEWAAGIPGTIGAAIVGNAGAHDGEISGSLIEAEVLHRNFLVQDNLSYRESWFTDRFDFEYRSSVIKRSKASIVVLSAVLMLELSNREMVQEKIDDYASYRLRTQPPGASMGSMFKNPSGDYAGRLIEAAGLKGARIGDAEISNLHANFFINHGHASAKDIHELISLAHQTVLEEFGVDLDLEIELVGDW